MLSCEATEMVYEFVSTKNVVSSEKAGVYGMQALVSPKDNVTTVSTAEIANHELADTSTKLCGN